MGTVGLSFGSPTGGTGFDVTSTVNQIVTNLQSIETPWKNQLTTLQAKDTALSNIGTDLSSLTTAIQSLSDFSGVLSAKQGSSSDTDVLQLSSAASTAVAGSHTIVVTSLAKTASWVSGAISNASDTLSGSLTINGQTLTIDSSDNTLSSLATAINSGSFGVTANVITDSSGTRLSLVSQTSGAAGNVSVTSSLQDATNSTALNISQAVTGADAQLTVDGIPVTSASNTVTTAIQGVTFQLLSASPSENIQVEITNDNSSVESAMSTFVSAYNKVVGDLNTQEGKDASGNAEPLFGSSTLATLQNTLEQAITFAQSSGSITSLTQLGITMNNDGTLTLNNDTLDSVLNSNFSGVVNFFQPSGVFTSFGGNLSTALNNLGNNAPNGIVFLALQEDSNEEKQLNTNISNEETIISAKKTQLTTELNQANFILTEIPQQIDNINESFSAITGFNPNQH